MEEISSGSAIGDRGVNSHAKFFVSWLIAPENNQQISNNQLIWILDFGLGRQKN